MAADDALARAIDGIADGAVVNWRALQGMARSDEERAELKWLQVLGELANVHRSAHDEAAESDENELTHELPAGAPIGIENWGQYRLVRRLGEGGFTKVEVSAIPLVDVKSYDGSLIVFWPVEAAAPGTNGHAEE